MSGKRPPLALPSAQPLPKRPRDVPSDLNEDALGIVMEFLAPKELFRMAFLCKALTAKITTRLVVRSAIMHGGNARKTIDELYSLMKDMSIHVPSPLRLLRLVNGKVCEACLENRVNFVRPGYGVFFCWECLRDDNTRKINTESYSFRTNPRYIEVLNHPRVAAKGGFGKFCYVWKLPLHQNGEYIGPLIDHGEIEEVVTGSDPVDNMLGGLPPAQDYEEFVTTYEASREEASKAAKYRQEKKEKTSQNATQRRIASSLKIVSKIRERLDEPLRDFALAYEETGYTGKSPCLRFKVRFVDPLLKEYVTAPSKAKKTVIDRIAAEINQAFRPVMDSQLLSFSFLSDDDPFEARLKQYYQESFPDLESIGKQPNLNERFFGLLQEGKLYEAMTCFTFNFGHLLLHPGTASSPRERDFAREIWQFEANKAAREERSSLQEERDRVIDPLQVQHGKVFRNCLSSMPLIRAAADQYVEWLIQQEESNEVVDFARGPPRDYWAVCKLYKKDFDGLRNDMKRSIEFDQRRMFR